MKKLAVLSLLLGAGALAGCSSVAPAKKVITVHQMVYPSVVSVTKPTAPQLYKVSFNLPKNQKGEIEKVFQTCRSKKKPALTKKCMAANALATDVFVGLSERNYVHLMMNLYLISQYIHQYQNRIDKVNSIFTYWRNKNNSSKSASKSSQMVSLRRPTPKRNSKLVNHLSQGSF